MPLLLDEGPELSTRTIARAAGVAEGTIFRAFETKHDLLHATICAALQPDAALAALADLPSGQPLEERVEQILIILRGEVQRTRALFVHLTGADRPPHPPPGHHRFPGGPHEAKSRLVDAASVALEPYAAALAVPPTSAAYILASLAFAAGFLTTTDSRFEQPRELANAVLHGIAKGAS